jgi:hypothetical protein
MVSSSRSLIGMLTQHITIPLDRHRVNAGSESSRKGPCPAAVRSTFVVQADYHVCGNPAVAGT